MADHQHVWAKEPPQGEQFSERPSIDRRGDMLDVAHNSFWTSPEELKRLRLLREEDPGFENSSDWPMVVERYSRNLKFRGNTFFECAYFGSKDPPN